MTMDQTEPRTRTSAHLENGKNLLRLKRINLKFSGRKVWQTLTFSMRELAVILGNLLTAADLVFSGFLKDLAEVPVGALKQLYDFLKLLREDQRRASTSTSSSCRSGDSRPPARRNWSCFHYQQQSEQLIIILDFFGSCDIHGYLRHVALKLCADKVSEVLWISFKLVVVMLWKFYSHGACALELGVK